MNTPIKFELAKLLKEKGFEEECLFYYNKQGELPERWESSGSSTDTDVPIYLEEFEANFNSPRLVGVHQIGDVSCSAPTVAEVVMWLYEKHGIWISVYQYKDYAADVNDDYVFRTSYTQIKEFKSPTEAYEAAIEYTLNNLI